MPEALISGDSSNANLASALVAEAPFIRGMVFRQWHYRNEYKQVMERVLDFAAIHGMLGVARENVLDDLEVSVEMPPVVPRKLLEETQRNQILHENSILSPEDWAAKRPRRADGAMS